MPDDLTALEMPAAAIIKRLQDEGFLNNTVKWFTIQGGAQRLAESLANVLSTENLHLNAEIVSVSSEEHGVRLVEANGHHHIYDHVIMATPAEQTRALLERGGWVSEEESKFLSAYKWQSINTGSTEANGSASVSPSKTTKIKYTSTPAPPAYDESQPGITQHISLQVHPFSRTDKQKHNAQRAKPNPKPTHPNSQMDPPLPIPRDNHLPLPPSPHPKPAHQLHPPFKQHERRNRLSHGHDLGAAIRRHPSPAHRSAQDARRRTGITARRNEWGEGTPYPQSHVAAHCAACCRLPCCCWGDGSAAR